MCEVAEGDRASGMHSQIALAAARNATPYVVVGFGRPNEGTQLGNERVVDLASLTGLDTPSTSTAVVSPQ